MPSSIKGVEPELQLSTRTTTRCGDGGNERVAVNRGRSRTTLTTWQGGVWAYKKRATEDENIEKRRGWRLPKREAGEQPDNCVASSSAKQHLRI